jgi:hypothetical protein
VLTAALALVALPGLAGSRVPDPIDRLPDSAFQTIDTVASGSRSIAPIAPLDRAAMAAGPLTATTAIREPVAAPRRVPTARPALTQPVPQAESVRKPPLDTLTGYATFYDNGTTAMRLPRGTVVIICGAGGCIQRVVNDYGPQKPSRIVDLYRPDFFKICGCPSYSGTTKVTVYVY